MPFRDQPGCRSLSRGQITPVLPAGVPSSAGAAREEQCVHAPGSGSSGSCLKSGRLQQDPEPQISNPLMTQSSELSGCELRMLHASEQSPGWVPTSKTSPNKSQTLVAWLFPAKFLPCLSFSTCQMGITITASHLRNLAGSICSGHMEQCKKDFVTLAVSFTSPHSPIDISTAEATTGLGKVLLNA